MSGLNDFGGLMGFVGLPSACARNWCSSHNERWDTIPSKQLNTLSIQQVVLASLITGSIFRESHEA